MTLTSKQLAFVAAVLAIGIVTMFVAKDAGPYAITVAVVGAAGILFAGGAVPCAL